MESNTSNSEHKPVFILGSGRSGTSILTGAIRSGGKIDGYLEGHFLPLMLFLMKEIERFYFSKRALLDDNRHMLANISQEEIEQDIMDLFRRKAEALATSPIWLDKSPDSATIKMAPYIIKTWPQARLIFAKRRGIENIISRLKKFPHVSFEQHCLMWVDCMKSWLLVKDSLNNYLEIDQRQIALQPDEIAKEIGEFLELNQSKVDSIKNIFINQRPQSTGSKETQAAINIQETGWTNEEISIFRKHCTEVSEKFGYSESSSYYL
jgi:hypothetical protein